jgi:hypothetical protein
VSAPAVVSLVLGLVSLPLTFCMTLAPPSMGASDAAGVALSVLGVILPGAALALAVAALRRIEGGPRAGGRALAMTGLVTGLTGIVWCLTTVLIVIVHHLQG